MMCRQLCFGIACVLGILSCQFAFGSGSIFDPLTSFNAGGYTVSAADPIVYDAAGAHFGTGVPGDGGRSYQRTKIRSFALSSTLVAEITFELSTAVSDNGTPADPLDDFVVGDTQAVFFGMGAGDTALFGTPDWSTTFSSASFWPESGTNKFTRFRTQNDHNSFGDTNITGGLDPGIHRFRMTFNGSTNQLLGEIDKNYAGGPFVADAVTVNFPIVVTSLFVDDDPSGDNGPGWPTEPSRIFFGGDDGVILRDLSINYVPEPTTAVMMLLGFAGMVGRRVR